MAERRVIDLRALYGEQAKRANLPAYLEKARALAGEGNEVVLTGQAPVWLYLKVATHFTTSAGSMVHVAPVSTQRSRVRRSSGR